MSERRAPEPSVEPSFESSWEGFPADFDADDFIGDYLERHPKLQLRDVEPIAQRHKSMREAAQRAWATQHFPVTDPSTVARLAQHLRSQGIEPTAAAMRAHAEAHSGWSSFLEPRALAA